MNRLRVQLSLLFLLGSTVLSSNLDACSSQKAVPPNLFNQPLKVRWDRWTTSQLAASVAGILLKEQLGFDIEFVRTINGQKWGVRPEVYKAVSAGKVHVAFEVWPHDRREDFERFASFDVSQAVARGARAFNTTMSGRIGIYETCSREKTSGLRLCHDVDVLNSPPLLLEFLATTQGQTHFDFAGSSEVDPVVRQLCALPGRRFDCDTDGVWTPSHCAGAANCSAYILHITPTYNEGFIESLVRDLRLPVKVKYLGVEGHRKALWESYMHRRGGLFYMYNPIVMPEGVHFQDLPRAVVGSMHELPSRPLQKLAWVGLTNNAGLDAYTFVENFVLTEADYAKLTEHFQLTHDVQVAACLWVQNNKDIWSPWIQFPQRSTSTVSEVCSAQWRHKRTPCDFSCALLIFGQFSLGLTLLLVSRCKHKRKLSIADLKPLIAKVVADATDAAVERGDVPSTGASPTASNAVTIVPFELLSDGSKASEIWLAQFFRNQQSQKGVLQDIARPFLAAKHRVEDLSPSIVRRKDFVRAFQSAPVSIRHVRTFTGFCRRNVDPAMNRPPDYPESCWNGGTTRRPLYQYLVCSGAWLRMLIRCIALSLLSGGASSVIWLTVRLETYRVDNVAYMLGGQVTGSGTFSEEISRSADTFNTFTTVFKFFPSFLLFGYVTYAVNRWRSFLEIGFAIQGRIHDVSLLVGGAIADPNSRECRQLAFNVYRLLTLVHLLVYKGKHPWLDAMDMEDVVALGLLTRAELEHLIPAKNKMRDTALAWLSREIQLGLSLGLLNPSCTVTCLDQLALLRAKMAAFHDRFSLNQPNLWAALMQCVVDMLVLVFVAGSPFAMFVYEVGCFQCYVFAFTFFLTLPWACCLAMITIINDPYLPGLEHDFFNVDALMGSSEQVAFHNLRISFDFPLETTDCLSSRSREASDGTQASVELA